jgi:CDP-diacylglycerol--glycerol-3-phosphate 3-phosphatidyltransferase
MSTTTSVWPDLGRFWTAANVLSLTRLVLVGPIAVLLWQDGPLGWLLGLTIAAIMTDWFDGRVARWTRSVSEWGKVIDPVADKVAAVLTVSVLTFRPAEPTLPLWFFGLIVGRDLLILAGGAWIARRSGKVLMSAWAGKAASLWLALTVLSVILKADPPVLNVCLWMATGLFVFSFGVYVVRYLNAIRRSPPPRGPAAPAGDGGTVEKESPDGSETTAAGSGSQVSWSGHLPEGDVLSFAFRS